MAFSLAPAALPTVAVAAAKPRPACPTFRQVAQGPVPLAHVDIYDGPVADNATLAPDTSDTVGGKLVSRWSFAADRKITVYCAYGAKGPYLTKVLTKATNCVVTFRPAGGANWKPESVICG